MFTRHKILGICLILVALFAPTAHAEEVLVDPGTPGSEAKNFDFTADSGLLIDIIFTDNKTLEWEAGTHLFATPGSPFSWVYSGVLLDASGNAIPGTLVYGQTQAENEPVPFGLIQLSDRTVFSGISLTSLYSQFVVLSWTWDDDDRPLVGEVIEGAAGFVKQDISCPVSGASLKAPGSQLEVSDIVISSDAVTDVKIRFNNPNTTIMTVYMGANETVTANFTGQIGSAEEQALKVDCGGSANISVTIVGTEAF